MLSQKLLAVLRAWWKVGRPRHWLFPGERPETPIMPDAVRYACQLAVRRARLVLIESGGIAIPRHLVRGRFALVDESALFVDVRICHYSPKVCARM